MIEEILKYNKEFVEQKGYERFLTDKYPNKRIAIVTCMDTRLVELLPAALGLRNGDVKIIKNAGGTITNPFDSAMRSLLVAVYELGVTEIMVIGHTHCGVQGMDSAEMQHLMLERGVPASNITLMKHCGIDLDSWLHGFDDTAAAVNETVDLIERHPLMPPEGITVRGYIMDSVTGKLTSIVIIVAVIPSLSVVSFQPLCLVNMLPGPLRLIFQIVCQRAYRNPYLFPADIVPDQLEIIF